MVELRERGKVCQKAVFFYGECEHGHKFLKAGGCNKEICEVCGKEGSGLHWQRYGRWMRTALWMLKEYGTIGYMVITLPQEYWGWGRKELKEFRQFIKEKLKDLGFKKGKMRYHWAGDRNKTSYPHLNILIPGGWIDEEILARLKVEVAEWLGYEGQVVIDYHYSSDIRKIRHWVKYITRPTLLLIEDESLRERVWVEVVQGFRNDVEWGRPGKVDLKKSEEDWEILKRELKEEELKELYLLNSICPYCKSKIKWHYTREEPNGFWIPFRENIWEYYGNIGESLDFSSRNEGKKI
jgi:hypothetical protein